MALVHVAQLHVALVHVAQRLQLNELEEEEEEEVKSDMFANLEHSYDVYLVIKYCYVVVVN